MISSPSPAIERGPGGEEKMQSFKFTSQIDPKGVLNLQLPPSLANQEVDIVLVIHPKSQNARMERPIGQYAGKMQMSDDFSAPLSDEFG